MRGFDLLVDSSSDLPQDIMVERGITLVPMTFTLGGRDYTEDYWQSISPDEFYTRIKKGERSLTTQINRENFSEIFSRHTKNGRDVVFICLSSKLSGSHESAVAAADDVMKLYPGRRVRVVDSISATMGHGILTLTAADRGDFGMDADAVADYIEEIKHKYFAIFTVDDLMFLHAGGRLSRFSAIAGSLLGVKPVLWVCPEGYLKLRDKKRGRKGSLDWLVECMAKCVKPSSEVAYVGLTHGNCLEDAEYVKGLIQERFKVRNIVVNMLGPVIGTHAGPGTVALFFSGDITRTESEEK